MNDKFLNVCFKLGKIIFSILLLIALIVSIVFWVKTGISYSEINKIKPNYTYNVKYIVHERYADELGLKHEEVKQEEKTEKKADKDVETAIKEYNKYIDDNHLPASYKFDIKTIGDPSNKQKAVMINKMLEFHKDYRKEFVNLLKEVTKKPTDNIENFIKDNYKELYNDAATEFLNTLDIENKSIEIQKQAAEQQKQSNLFIALISFGIFILSLFLPILIRIEENTRK